MRICLEKLDRELHFRKLWSFQEVLRFVNRVLDTNGCIRVTALRLTFS